MKLLVINGPNLNLLGIREPDVYGTSTYDDLCQMIQTYAVNHEFTVNIQQFNGEGDLIDCLHGARGCYDGIILNPAAYTHYSYAIHDAVKSIAIPTIEVHISNITARESFRNHSVISPACIGQVSGLGMYGYLAAMQYFIHKESTHV